MLSCYISVTVLTYAQSGIIHYTFQPQCYTCSTLQQLTDPSATLAASYSCTLTQQLRLQLQHLVTADQPKHYTYSVLQLHIDPTVTTLTSTLQWHTGTVQLPGIARLNRCPQLLHLQHLTVAHWHCTAAWYCPPESLPTTVTTLTAPYSGTLALYSCLVLPA